MAQDQPEQPKVSRRGFIKGVSALIAASSISVVVAGCEPTPQAPPINPPGDVPLALKYPEVPVAPTVPPNPAVLRFFTPHEARTVDALVGRILPGTPEDPGAREAGVLTYIDNILAYSEGFAEKVYREAPFAEVYEEAQPPQSEGGFETVWVAADQMERYGYQSILNPREVYRTGVRAVDQYAQSKHGSLFIQLSEEQQNSIIQDLVDNKATGFDQFSPKAFFLVLRRHTGEGMFGDPRYGGNRDMAGWKLIGFPGSHRAYTRSDIQTEGANRPYQSLDGLSPFSPGQNAGNYPILPVSGSDIATKDPDDHTHQRPQP